MSRFGWTLFIAFFAFVAKAQLSISEGAFKTRPSVSTNEIHSPSSNGYAVVPMWKDQRSSQTLITNLFAKTNQPVRAVALTNYLQSLLATMKTNTVTNEVGKALNNRVRNQVEGLMTNSTAVSSGKEFQADVKFSK